MFQIAEREASIAALGDRDLGYLTHREIDAAMRLVPDGVDLRWVATDSEEARRIDSFDGLWVLPGTPYRDDEAVYAAIRFGRHPRSGPCRDQAKRREGRRRSAGVQPRW